MTDEPWIIDTIASERYPVYTRLNANDVMPDPVTPVGASLTWIPDILPGWASGYVRQNAFTADEMAPDPNAPAGGFFYGYLYVNQTTVRIIGIRSGIGSDAIDAAFFTHPNPPPHRASAGDVNESLSEQLAGTVAWTLSATSWPELDEEKEFSDRLRMERPDLSTVSNDLLVNRARAASTAQRLFWSRAYCVASSQSALGPGIIASLVGAADPTLTIRIIGSAGDVDSALPSYALWDLSREVRADGELAAAFDKGEDGLLDWLRDAHPAFAAKFAAFLHEYGYRGPSEWDPGADSWEIRPELPLALLGRLRHLEDDQSPALKRDAKAVDAAAALEEALAILGDNEEAVQTLHVAVASARRFASWRERGKTSAVKAIHEVRLALFELGRRLTAEGHLDHPRQVMMALSSELDILAIKPSELTEVLRAREVEWKKLFDFVPPTFVVGGEPMTPMSELVRRDAGDKTTVQPGDVLLGAGASAGVARGRARVIRDMSQIGAFEPGEILIAPQTDPSWTPLFMVAGGVVVDVGAMGSHAMIVSRELGIPCAAGVGGASARIPDGTLVEVDGSAGRVTILEG